MQRALHAQLHVMNCSEDLLEIGPGANTTAQIRYKNKAFDSTAHPAAVAPYLKLPPPYKAGPDERGCVKSGRFCFAARGARRERRAADPSRSARLTGEGGKQNRPSAETWPHVEYPEMVENRRILLLQHVKTLSTYLCLCKLQQHTRKTCGSSQEIYRKC